MSQSGLRRVGERHPHDDQSAHVLEAGEILG
jgi:hypothetical protein